MAEQDHNRGDLSQYAGETLPAESTDIIGPAHTEPARVNSSPAELAVTQDTRTALQSLYNGDRLAPLHRYLMGEPGILVYSEDTVATPVISPEGEMIIIVVSTEQLYQQSLTIIAQQLADLDSPTATTLAAGTITFEDLLSNYPKIKTAWRGLVKLNEKGYVNFSQKVNGSGHKITFPDFSFLTALNIAIKLLEQQAMPQS